ncbi:hypothetical protein EC973_004196 [Apophysomyces ossiformis]|uniref:Uncharacterized protein n=1 Tax=Apophysomyces ossiformis TaxID=679940 RepID=A0A8H7BV79_9FUNG|nr:hypothetical protein EC973_004196 [Apophysomyces ossiformis]
MTAMEREYELMQENMCLDSISSTASCLYDTNTCQDNEEENGMLTPISLVPSSPSSTKSMTVAEANGFRATVTPRACSWTLSASKGNLCIETTIKKHSELLDNLQHMCTALGYQYRIPSNFYSHTDRSILVTVMNVILTRKYDKVHCRSVAKSVQISIAATSEAKNAIVKAKASLGATTMRLLQAYLQCQHYKQLAIHARAFFQLFVQQSCTDISPAVMALCAMICSLRCKHIINVLPMHTLLEYGQYYFERARELLEDKFDDADLETFASYIFMAIYKLTVSHAEEGVRYGDMAERMSYLLKPRYNNEATSCGEAILFQRLLQFLHRVRTYEEVSMDRRKACCSNNNTLRYCTLTNYSEGHWEVADEETEREKQFAHMHDYILKLQRETHQASRSLQSCNIFHLAQIIAYQVELAARHWYIHVLPPNFRLSLSLFDSSVSDEVLHMTLERECAQSAIPILTTLAVYDEYMVVGQSYVPKYLPDAPGPTTTAEGCCKEQKACCKARRRTEKLLELRREVEFDGTDEEYLEQVSSLVKADAQSVQLNVPVIHQSVQAAICTIRLLCYLRSRAKDCYFEMRILMNAWHVLTRVLRLEQSLPLELKAKIPVIRTNLVICLNIVRDEFRLLPSHSKLDTLITVMEQEIQGHIVSRGVAGPF